MSGKKTDYTIRWDMLPVPLFGMKEIGNAAV